MLADIKLARVTFGAQRRAREGLGLAKLRDAALKETREPKLICTYKVGDLRRSLDLEAINKLLHFSISIGHAFVLPEMFCPGDQHEGFDETAVFAHVFKDLPLKGPIAATLTCQVPDSGEKALPVSRSDLILDSHKDGASVNDKSGRHRCRPMLGRS